MSVYTNSTHAVPQIQLDCCSELATVRGTFELLAFSRLGSAGQSVPIVALKKGQLSYSSWPLIRIQSKCTTSEVFGSQQCDCADQLHISMSQIEREGVGMIVYLDQEARGNGLLAKLRIYEKMQKSHISSDEACEALGYPVEMRTYEDAAAILRFMGLDCIQLLTNNPDKVQGLSQFGFNIERVPILGTVNDHNYAYLLEKQLRHGHQLGLS